MSFHEITIRIKNISMIGADGFDIQRSCYNSLLMTWSGLSLPTKAFFPASMLINAFVCSLKLRTILTLLA